MMINQNKKLRAASSIAMVLVLAIGMVACSKKSTEPLAELVVSTAMIFLSNHGETKVFHVKSNVDWTASSSESWLTLVPSVGGSGTHKIEAIATVNPETTDRQAIITIRADNLTTEVRVVQTASVLFSINENQYTIGEQGGGFEVFLGKQCGLHDGIGRRLDVSKGQSRGIRYVLSGDDSGKRKP